MGFLDSVDPDKIRNKLKGLLGDMPITQMVHGEFEMPKMPTRNGLAQALLGMPKPFQNTEESNKVAMDAALNVLTPMGLLGKIVYHGSPHKFDKFDASKIGTGEGAQAYGHGVYLADAEEVAKGYQKGLSGNPKWAADGIDLGYASANPSADAARMLNQYKGHKEALEAVDRLKGQLYPLSSEGYRNKLLAEMDRLKTAKIEEIPAGALYKADLPDEWIPKMLDWDKPLKEQSKEVQNAIAGLTKHDKVWARNLANNPNMKGEELYKALSNVEAGGAGQWNMPGNSAGATNTLNALGIPGIRYLDGSSRGKGQGSYNYVVFPGLEDKVKILERNGIPLTGLLNP